MTVTTINVTDMHCAACTNKISAALEQFSTVSQLQFNPVRRQVFVTHDDSLAASQLLERIEDVGFTPRLEGDSRVDTTANRVMLKRLGVAGLAMMQVMMVQIALYAGAFQGIEDSIRRLLEFTALLFCIPVVTYSAVPFFVNALKFRRQGLNMDTPIALAIAIAFTISLTSTLTGSGEVYYDSVVMFTFLMLGARYLEQRMRHHLQVEDALLSSLPVQTLVVRDNQHVETALEDVRLGDELWITEGARLPADGQLLTKSAMLEEAWLTGEDAWRHHERGAQLYAGTLNTGPAFAMAVTALPADSRAAEIDKLANTALAHKHKLARLADAVARIFIPSILLLATATYLVWQLVDPAQALTAALAVLVVSCPCALSLATPTALTAALTRLRQAGVLVKASQSLESVTRISDVYFDKTGTLTDPRPQLTSIQTQPSFAREQCLEMAAALQMHSSHPLARAFHRPTRYDAEDVSVKTGAGISGTIAGNDVRIGSAPFCGFEGPTSESAGGKTVYLSINAEPAAVFSLSHDVRGDASATMTALKQHGLAVHMVSGDNDDNCADVAERLHIDYQAATTPEGKPAALRAASGGALYVGDGINDLPALASADISAATLETADLVKSKADVILLSKRLGTLVDFFNVGQRTRRIMYENLGWALAYNVIAIPLAALGYVPPWGAALGMSLSSLIVMANAGRLLKTPIGAQT